VPCRAPHPCAARVVLSEFLSRFFSRACEHRPILFSVFSARPQSFARVHNAAVANRH
jgi:hypothetical protein